METLRAINQLENTMVIFLSDNGGCYEDPVPEGAKWAIHPTDGVPGSARSFPSYGTPWANASNTPFSYFKSYLHEGGIITPLIVHYPSMIPAGEINNSTVGHIMDLFPTMIDLAGVAYPEEINGRAITPTTGVSLLPAMQGKIQNGHDTLFWEHQYNKAVRMGDWKLVAAYKIMDTKGISDRWELYNLKDDPTEQYNLSTMHPAKVRNMEKLYDQWAQQVMVLTKDQLDSLRGRKDPN